MNFTEKSCSRFTEELASKAAVPGGGGASALAGALAASLGCMVGALTVGKKKYAAVESRMEELIRQGQELRRDLLCLVEEDARAFAPLAKAYGMAADTEEEKAEKQQVMERALRDACRVPLEIMEKCCRIIELQKEFAEKGSTLAVSDAGAGVIFAKSALQGASLNVFINTASMQDRQFAEKTDQAAEKMLQEYTVAADEVFAKVYSGLRK